MDPKNNIHEEGNLNCACGPQSVQTVDTCCGSQSQKTEKKVLIKKILFFVIVMAAAGIAIHSLIKNKNPDPKSQFSGISFINNSAACVSLASLSTLNSMAADKDFVFVIVPQNDEVSGEISKTIYGASDKISGLGKKAGVYSLMSNTADHQKLVAAFKIKTFPAVVAMGKGCGMNVITGPITENKLMAGYAAAMKPQSGCCPR